MTIGTNVVSVTYNASGSVAASLAYEYDTVLLKMTAVIVVNSSPSPYSIAVQNLSNNRNYGPFTIAANSGTTRQAIPTNGNQVSVAVDTDGSVFVPDWTYQFGPTS